MSYNNGEEAGIWNKKRKITVLSLIQEKIKEADKNSSKNKFRTVITDSMGVDSYATKTKNGKDYISIQLQGKYIETKQKEDEGHDTI